MIATTLGILIQDMSAEMTPLIIQCLNTITEFVQGNQLNQRAVFDARIIDHVNTIIRANNAVMGLPATKTQLKASIKQEGDVMTNDVISMGVACAELMERMLESNDSDTEYVAKESEKILDVACIFKMIHQYMLLNEEVVIKNGGDSEQLSAVSFVWFTVVSRLQHFSHKEHIRSESGTGKVGAQEDVEEKSMSSCEATGASIELVVDGVLQKVHFHVDPAWRRDIRAETKDKLLWSVDRGSMIEQTRDFVERSRVIIADMKYMKSVLRSSRTNNFIQKNSNLWSQMMLLVTFLINALMLITWIAPKDNTSVVPIYAFTNFLWYAMQALGGVHLVLTLLVARSFFLANPPSLHPRSREPDSSTAPKGQTEKAKLKSGSLDLVRILNTRTLFEMKFQTSYSWFSGGSVYHLLLVAMSILGIALHGYTFCFHLFHVVAGNDILSRVLRAVTDQARPLANVAGLLMIIIYVYSVVAFALMRKFFDHSIGAYCDTMYECFVTSLRLGLISGGGMGEALPFSPVHSFVEPGLRSIFDLSFFIIVVVIGLNVVFGVYNSLFTRPCRVQKKYLTCSHALRTRKHTCMHVLIIAYVHRFPFSSSLTHQNSFVFSSFFTTTRTHNHTQIVVSLSLSLFRSFD